jgi:membrane protein
MSLVERLDRFQQRHPWSGFPIAVIYKFADDQGPYLAALITYYGFLSLFPLLLLLSTALGFVLSNNEDLQQQVIDSTLAQFPVIGQQLETTGLRGSGVGLVVGLVLTLYGGLGVGQATQNAMNIAWAVPRSERPNPVVSRLRSLLLLLTVGLAILGTTILAALGSSAGSFGADVRTWVRIALTGLAVVLNTGIFILAFRVATARKLTLGEIVPGAVGAALTWQILQSFGALYVGQVVKNSNATYGVFALVLGLLAFIYIEAVAIVLCVEINVVRSTHLYPRALLTLFTDAVDLTKADERAYTGYAEAQKHKSFETVDVSFEGPPDADEDKAPGAPR